MSFKANNKFKNWNQVVALTALGLLAICLVSCGEDYTTVSQSDSSDTGSYSFSLSWPDGTAIEGASSTPSRAVDCVAEGIDTIVAAFYNSDGILLKSPPDEYICSVHSGSVTGLVPGSNYRLLVRCEDSSGSVLFEGEATGITIVAGETVQGGEILMAAVVTPTCTDSDLDEYYAESGCDTDIDCNDNDGDINPGETEVCDDSKDNDCDGNTDCDDSDCSGTSVCDQTQTDTAGGLIAYFPFEGDANDSSGNAFDGTVNGATLTTDRFGNPDSAYSFDGVDDYIKLPLSLSLAITDNDFSYSIWFDAMTGTPINMRTNAVSGSYHRKAGLIFLWNNNIEHKGVGSNDSGQIEKQIAFNDLPEFYQYDYNHLVFVRSGNLHQIYINGSHIQELDITVSGETLLIDDILVVGKHLYSGTSNTFLEGKIDEIRFYNQALSSTEIKLLYEADYANSLGMTFKMIPAGTFTMGSPESELGRQDSNEYEHEVTLTQNFYIQTTEVTQGQWEAVMGGNPSYFSSCGSQCPVEEVSWDDIQAFLATLNNLGEGTYSLPTEAQWEYAARAGSTTAFANGDILATDCSDDANLDAMGWYCYNANDSTHQVAQKTANAWGLYDMHGNVYEWVSDWYQMDLGSDPVIDPTGPDSGSVRVRRGGGRNSDAKWCRSARRTNGSPSASNSYLGFRLLRSL